MKCPIIVQGLNNRPAAGGVDGRVNVFHKHDGFGKGRDDLLIVRQIVIGELAAFPVFEPLSTSLIAADMKLPNILRDSVKILCSVESDAPSGFTLRFGAAQDLHGIVTG